MHATFTIASRRGQCFPEDPREAERGLDRGQTLLDLSIGEPKGAALLSAREAARDAIMSEDEPMHAYQYNDSPAVPGFFPRFVRAHLKQGLPEDDVDYLPISGVKPISLAFVAARLRLCARGDEGRDDDEAWLSDTG